MAMLTIDVLYYEDCPHYEEAARVLKEVLEEEGVEATVKMVKVAKWGEAEAFGFIGSPTILINGEDVEKGMDHTSPFQGHCRVYLYKEEMFEVPPKEMIREALKRFT
jgi:glutaredoxin